MHFWQTICGQKKSKTTWSDNWKMWFTYIWKMNMLKLSTSARKGPKSSGLLYSEPGRNSSDTNGQQFDLIIYGPRWTGCISRGFGFCTPNSTLNMAHFYGTFLCPIDFHHYFSPLTIPPYPEVVKDRPVGKFLLNFLQKKNCCFY